MILIQNIFFNGFGGISCEVPMNLFHFSLTQLKVTKLNVLCKGVEKDSIKELNIVGETIHLGIVSYSSRMEETVGGQFSQSVFQNVYKVRFCNQRLGKHVLAL